MRISNRALGDAIGVSPSMASRLRNGKRLPSLRVLTVLADYLELDLFKLTNAHTQGAEAFGKIIRKGLGE